MELVAHPNMIAFGPGKTIITVQPKPKTDKSCPPEGGILVMPITIKTQPSTDVYEPSNKKQA